MSEHTFFFFFLYLFMFAHTGVRCVCGGELAAVTLCR